MRTIVVSDLHLGSGGDIDLLRRPQVRETLWAEIQGADEVVLLGDVVELRDRPLAEALELARPFFDELGSALGAGRVLVVPGNHDHHLLDDWLERRRLSESAPLGLEQRIPFESGPLAQLVAGMGRTPIELAYPGAWLRPGVYATHGHYLDRHLTVPTFERLAVAAVERVLGGTRAISEEPGSPGDSGSASVEDYERTLAPVYAFLFALAQAGSAGGTARRSQPFRQGLAGPGRRLRPRRQAPRLVAGHGRPPGRGGRRQPTRPGPGQVRPLPRRDHAGRTGGDRRGDPPAGHRRGPSDLRATRTAAGRCAPRPDGGCPKGRASGTPGAGSTLQAWWAGRPRTARTGPEPSRSWGTTARPCSTICSTTAAAPSCGVSCRRRAPAGAAKRRPRIWRG